MTRLGTLASESRRAKDGGCFTLTSQSIWTVIREDSMNCHALILLFLPPQPEELIDVVQI